MDRIAVFVDAGYLFAQGAVALEGRRLQRGELLLDAERAIDALDRQALIVADVPLLRVYWYDGTSTGPTPQHITLAHLPRLKIRLGFVNSAGEQKGVDSLIVTDMIALARNRAMSDALLLSGDEDLRVGVQQAQEFGVRVHLLGIRPSRGSQSQFLLQEADSTHEWGPDELRQFLSCRPRGALNVAPKRLRSLDEVAAAVAQTIDESELKPLLESIRQAQLIPKDIDSRLLAKGRASLDATLDSSQKRQVRSAFVAACERRLGWEAGGGRTSRVHD